MPARLTASSITDDQLDALYARLDATGASRPTRWPQAADLQHAAAALRRGDAAPANILPGDLADWLDATADALAWLAPYRPHEGGWGMWTAAERVAAALPAHDTQEPTRG